MDQEKMIGATGHTITQGEIDAWHRGEQDAAKNKLMSANTRLSVNEAIKLIRAFADLGDIHHAATRFDVPAEEVRRILNVFSVNSIEDAKKIVGEGTIADLDKAVKAQQDTDEVTRRADHEAAQAAFESDEKPKEGLTNDEKDARLAARQADAQKKNKEDQIRALIAEGIDPATNTSGMRIPLALIPEFKSMIPRGIGNLQRRFGGTEKDLINEIKRLSPSTPIDMLRR